MSEKTTNNQEAGSALFRRTGMPSFAELAPNALQHVLACFAGVITPAIIMAGVCGFDESQKAVIIQVALILSAIDTLLQQFPLFGKIGSGLPILTGISFAFLPAFQAIGKQFVGEGLDAATTFSYLLGAEVVGGFVAILFGTFYSKLKRFFPPLVTGTVIFTIGVSLYPTAISYIAGGKGSVGFGGPANWIVGLITFAVVFGMSNFCKGIFKLGSIFFGMIIGIIVAIPFNIFGDALFGAQAVLFDPSAVANVGHAGWFAIPKFMPFGAIRFDLAACITIAVVYIMGNVQLIGDLSAATMGSMDRMPNEHELSGAIRAQGVVSLISSLFGGLPTSAFGQNVGIITSTRVINRWVFAGAAAIFLIAGFVPNVSAVLTLIPQAVIGGATIGVFGTITLNGIRILVKDGLTPRTCAVFGVSVALGLGITQVTGALAGEGMPGWINTIFGTSAITPCALMAIILNAILPPEEKKEAKAAEAPQEAKAVETAK